MRQFLAIFVSFIVLNACADSQLGSQSSSKDGKNETIQEGKEATLSVNSGPLQGASVNVPAGALETGSNLNINSADVPESFEGHSGVSSASDPLSVSATGPDGSPVTQISSAMTLQLPISNLATALTDVDRTTDNLCVFLNTADGDFLVWRRDLLFINENIVTFESNLFGVFQLYFCGQQTLASAKDAKEEKVSGSTSNAIVTLTVPKGSTYSQGTACLALVSGLNYQGGIDVETDYKIYGATQAAISSSSDSTVELFGVPGAGLNNIGDDTAVHFIIAFQSSTDKCTFEPESRTKLADTVNGNTLFGFKRKAVDLKNNIEGTFGEGDFSISTINISLNNSSSGAAHKDADGCVNIATNGDFEGGFAMGRTKFNINGQINSSSSYDGSFVSSSSSENSVNFYLNTTECLLDSIDNGTVTEKEATQPYGAKFVNLNLDSDSIQLAPTTFKVKTNAAIAALADRACIQLFSTAAGDTSNSSSEERQNLQIFQYVSGLTTSFTNDVYYIPVVSGDAYATFIKPLTGDESCISNKDGYAETSNSFSDFSSIDILNIP